MKPENKQFLDDNRPHYETLVQAGFMSLEHHVKAQMLNVMREEFEPSYHTTLWCGKCVMEMVMLLYRRYDEYLQKEVLNG